MGIEIEAKLKVDSLDEIADRLKQLGAEFAGEQFHTDCYFDNTDESLLKSDTGLRLRRQLTGDDEKIILTYKGAKQKSDLKKRQEIEIELGDGDSIQKILSALGYNAILEFEKRRLVWRFGDCIVALDELALLGSFVEIEGPDDKTIIDVQEKLGLIESVHINKSYAAMIADKLGR